MPNKFVACLILLYMSPYCVAEQNTLYRTLCVVVYSHDSGVVRSNDIDTALSHNIDQSKPRDNRSYTCSCSDKSMQNLTSEFNNRKIPHSVQTHSIPIQNDAVVTIPGHICYDNNNTKQCIDYQIALSQNQQQELQLTANIYQQQTNGQITNLHKLDKIRRLKSRQPHYIDDQDVGILILHSF